MWVWDINGDLVNLNQSYRIHIENPVNSDNGVVYAEFADNKRHCLKVDSLEACKHFVTKLAARANSWGVSQ